MLNFQNDSVTQEDLLNKVMETKWKYANTYWVGNAEDAEDRVPVWYILDEFGSRIQHSASPNVRLVPFLCMLDGAAYSLLFPIRLAWHFFCI